MNAVHPCDVAAVVSRQRHALHPGAGGSFESPDNVCRIPRRGDADEHVTGSAHGPHLPGEHLFITEVVGTRRHDGSIRRQRHARQSRPFHLEAAYQLAGHVLGVGRGTAVAADQDLVALGEGFNEQAGGAFDRLQMTHQSLLGVDGVLQDAGYLALHGVHRRQSAADRVSNCDSASA